MWRKREEIAQFVTLASDARKALRSRNGGWSDIEADHFVRGFRERADIVTRAAARHEHTPGERFRRQKIDQPWTGRAFVPRSLTLLILRFPVCRHQRRIQMLACATLH